MRVLLDTHTFIWFTDGDPRLSRGARHTIEFSDDLRLSIATLWEMAIKISIGKLDASHPIEDVVTMLMPRNGILSLPITAEHVTAVSNLPLHHRDPFDRMLVAQALVEGIPIVSADTVFDSYGIQRIW